MNILHVEDHPLFSDGLGRLLSYQHPDVCVTQIADMEFLLQALRSDIDLVLFDLYLPEMSGIKMMRQIRDRHYFVPVAFLSASEEIPDIKQCMDEGAMGFIPKSLSSDLIVLAIMQILDGERFLTEKHQKAIQSVAIPDQADIINQYALSYKQLNVLDAMSQGLSNCAIAEKMGISESAIKYHISILFQSFDVKNRVECLRYAERIGLIT